MSFINLFGKKIAAGIIGGIFILCGVCNIFSPMYEEATPFYNLDVSFATIGFGVFICYLGFKKNRPKNINYHKHSLKENTLKVLGWLVALSISIAGAQTLRNLLYDYISRGVMFLDFRHFIACFASIIPALLMLIFGLFWIKFLRRCS